jgi:hypothetical protein
MVSTCSMRGVAAAHSSRTAAISAGGIAWSAAGFGRTVVLITLLTTVTTHRIKRVIIQRV